MTQKETIEWIPVSERLPEFNKWYLVTREGYEFADRLLFWYGRFVPQDARYFYPDSPAYGVKAWAE